MNEDYVSNSMEDSVLNIERKVESVDFINDTQMRKGKRITLDEYKKMTRAFWEIAEEKLLVDARENEFYHVYNTCRKDLDGKYNVLYSGMYKSIDKAREMIYRANDNNYGDLDDVEEELCDIYWWSIDKYRLTDENEYERIFHINQYDTSGLFGIEFHYKFAEYATTTEKVVYEEWEKLNGWSALNRFNIEFPYTKGDLLRVDNKPYSNTPDYYVYLENGLVFKKDTFGALSYQNIFSDGGAVGFYSFLPCHIEKVHSCSDKLFDKLACMIREKGDSVVEEIKNQLKEGRNEDFIDYMNRICEYEYELVTGEKVVKEFQKEAITFEEYLDLSKKTEKLFMSMFAEPLENDEVYLAKSYTRYDIDIKNHQEIFHDYDKMIEYIRYEGPGFYNQKNNAEPLEKIMWWRIEKKKLFDLTYKTTLLCELDASCNVINFELGDNFYERYHDDERYKLLNERMSLIKYDDSKKFKIVFPFEAGDVIYADKRPKQEPIECVYLGERHCSYGKIEYLCLTRSTFKENGKFQVTTIDTLGDFRFNKRPYFNLLQKRSCAVNKDIERAAEIIKINKAVALKIIALGDQVRYGGPDIIGNYLNNVI